VGKNVVDLEQISSGVKAITKGGISYTGDLLVGADGVHSAIRQQMWRLADQQDPAYFPAHDRKGTL
jgi:2-polyprenyl-6-methoxyphenol hydroxylase-like FAD-dependent oxidoreductase